MKKNSRKTQDFYIVVDENYDTFQICDGLDDVEEHIQEKCDDEDNDDYQDFLRVFEVVREVPFKYTRKVLFEEKDED